MQNQADGLRVQVADEGGLKMIIKKTFVCVMQDIDSVVLDVAEEIKKGWTIHMLHRLELKVYSEISPEPAFEIELRREDGQGGIYV